MPPTSILPVAAHTAAYQLVTELKEPETFVNKTNPHENGIYLFGFEDFPVIDVPVAGVFHRSLLGRKEDFVLGVISVMLIAVLSEIVQTVLMRTRESRVSKRGLHVAFVLDEVHHFRNVWRLLRRDPSCRKNTFRRSVAYNSLIIVGIAGALLAAEVFAVYLTQPVRLYTTEKEYNLQAVQPAGTTSKFANRIDELVRKKHCITPTMSTSNQSNEYAQSREYTLNACIVRAYVMALAGDSDVADWVDVTSWYHRGGSDHEIEFGNNDRKISGSHSIEIRASILQGHKISKGLLFEIQDNGDQDNSQYLQKYMLYTAMQWDCERDGSTPCKDMTKGLTRGRPKPVEKEVKLWEIAGKMRAENVTGIKVRFNVQLRSPFLAIEHALKVFATSAVIREVRGDGKYINLQSGEEENGVSKLVSEEGRVAGVLLLLVILIVLLAFLILLRLFLRPTSLAELARSTVDDDEQADPSDIFSEPSGKDFQGERTPDTSTTSFDSTSPRRFKKMLPKGLKGKGKEAVTSLDALDCDIDDFNSAVTLESS